MGGSVENLDAAIYIRQCADTCASVVINWRCTLTLRPSPPLPAAQESSIMVMEPMAS